MRQIDPFIAPQVWRDCKPALRRLLCKGAKLPPTLADKPFELLTHEQIVAIVSAAAKLEWACSEMTAMAPLSHAARTSKKGGAPLPVITLT